MSRLFQKFSLTLVILLALTSAAWANQCSALFFTDPFTKQTMTPEMTRQVPVMVKNLKSSTTGARVENKWTLAKNQIQILIGKLGSELSKANVIIKIRDDVRSGTRNVTHTVYLEQFSLNLKESGLQVSEGVDLEEVTFKPRIRKYGTVGKSKPVILQNVEFVDFTKDYSFVEFKFPDARYNGAVFKPRMYMADKYIKMFGTKEFLTHFDEIAAETLKLEPNLNDSESIKAMLKFFQIGHQKKVSFAKIALNLYDRVSYAIDFTDNSSSAKVQIQMTLDKSISLFIYELGRSIEAYEPDHTVVEVKTPVEYAQYSLNSDLSQIPGYSTFLTFINDVKTNHLPQYMEGVGKNGHGHRGFLNEVKKSSESAGH